MTERLIALINMPDDFRELLSKQTVSLQGWSGCNAIGIRLREGDDYPYFETSGFPHEFVKMEKHLCAYGPDGKILRDGAGNPVLECMCGNILCGRFDPGRPFFSAHGSFWTNSTTALLASTSEADRQALTRNRCNGMGYESVALIPLRTGDQVFGLLQFNDHRPNRFTPTLIAHFERMADSLAMALSQRQAVEAQRVSEERFRAAASSIPGAIYQFVRRQDGVESFFSKYPFCFLISPDGIIFLSSKSAMVAKSLWPLEKTVRERLIASRQFGNNIAAALIKKEIANGMDVSLGKNNYFVSRKVIDNDGWSIMLLTPTDRIGLYRWTGVLATFSVSILMMVLSAVIYARTDPKRYFGKVKRVKDCYFMPPEMAYSGSIPREM